MRFAPLLLFGWVLTTAHPPLASAEEDSSSSEGGHGGHAGPCRPGEEGENTDKTMADLVDETLESTVRGQRTECIGSHASTYPCLKVTLESFVKLADLHPEGPKNANDVWGWTSSTSPRRKFAIMGMMDGTSFVDVTDPSNAVPIAYMYNSEKLSSNWGDGKVYNNVFFKVTEANTYLQVLDLNRLTSIPVDSGDLPRTIDPNNKWGSEWFSSAHNFVVNEQSGFAAAVGTDACEGGLFMLDLKDPLNPSHTGCVTENGYTHDAQCVTYAGPDTEYVGREICFTYDEDEVHIVDVDDPKNPKTLSTLKYKKAYYTHQGWLTDDHKYILINDELDEKRTGNKLTTIVANVTELENPVVFFRHRSDTNSIDHNLYVKGRYMYQAQYTSGMAVYDLANVVTEEIKRVAYFDTYPDNDKAQFNGAWSVYPYFDDGTVLISSIGQGLFVVRPELGDNDDTTSTPSFAPSMTLRPFNVPTNVPTPRPSTSPTNVPSPRPFNEPTNVPSGAPTYFLPPTTPDDDNPAGDLSWDIELLTPIEVGETSDGFATLLPKFQISNRDYGLLVMDKDCQNELDDSVFTPTSNHENASNRPGYVNVNMELVVKKDEIKNAGLWSDTNLGGKFEFCLSTSLFTSTDSASETPQEKVTNKRVILTVAVTNVAEFQIANVDVYVPDVEEVDVSVSYDGTVTAFPCDPDTLQFVNLDELGPLGPFATVNVCVEADPPKDPMEQQLAVASFQDLEVWQYDSGITFIAVEDGATKPELDHLVVVDCKSQVMCLGRVKLIDSFFADGNAQYDLTIKGSVTLKPAVPKRLLLRVDATTTNKNERLLTSTTRVQKEFTVTVQLAQPCEGRKSSGIGFLKKVLKPSL